MARSQKCRFGTKGHCREHCPRSDGSIVRSIRRSARHIPEEAPLLAALTHLIARTIAGGDAPEVPTISRAAMRIASAVFSMHGDRVLGILKIVAALFPHEFVLNAAIVDPCMGEQMSEERA